MGSVTRSDGKVTQPIPDTIIFVKNKFSQKSGNMNNNRVNTECWKCRPRSGTHELIIFLVFDAERIIQTRHCRFLWRRRTGKYTPKHILAR